MQFYLAPLEGVTGYVYRNAYAKYFHQTDKYFSPFIVPHRNRGFKTRELRDIFPENNEGIYLVPQLLTNDAEDFLRAAKEFGEMGYEELNLNLGCPSKTVTVKGKGAGFLAKTDELERFLDSVFSKTEQKISVKTRLGTDDAEEFYRILEIYQKYPLEELIIHARVLKDQYQNVPNYEMFSWALEEYKGKIIYNGDIFSVKDYDELMKKLPKEPYGVMLGRGIIQNPSLAGEIKGEARATKEKLYEFHNEILKGYEALLSGDRNILFRMKELWFYMITMFEDSEKYAKKIKKVQTLAEYRYITEELFGQADLRL